MASSWVLGFMRSYSLEKEMRIYSYVVHFEALSEKKQPTMKVSRGSRISSSEKPSAIRFGSSAEVGTPPGIKLAQVRLPKL